MSNYYVSKAYVLHFLEGLREELKERGVRVSMLCPGPIHTALFREVGMRLGRLDRSKLMTTSEEIVLLALRGLDKSRALIIPGWRNHLLALSPRLASRRLVHRLTAQISASAVPSTPRG